MIILDIEASGLSTESYPIEVAWQHRYVASACDNFLIKPSANWTHWDKHAELHIHHIPRKALFDEGLPVIEAALRLNTQLARQVVYTDAVDYDRSWIKRLFNAAGIEMQFKVLCVYSLIDPAKVEAFKRTQAGKTTMHRALADARNIVDVLNYYHN